MSHVLTNWRDEQQRFRFSLPSCGIEWHIAIYCMLICIVEGNPVMCTSVGSGDTGDRGDTWRNWLVSPGWRHGHCTLCHHPDVMRTVTLVSPSTIVITTLSLHPPGHGMGHGTMELCIVWQTYKRKEEGILTIGYIFWCKQWKNKILLSNSLSLCKVEFMLQLAWAQTKSQGSFYDWKL